MLDLLAQHLDLGVAEAVRGRRIQQVGNQQLGAVVLDLGFVEHVFPGRCRAAGGIEQLLFQLGMDDQLRANLLQKSVLAVLVLRTFVFGKELLDPAVILLEGFDRTASTLLLRGRRNGRHGRRHSRVRVFAGLTCGFLGCCLARSGCHRGLLLSGARTGNAGHPESVALYSMVRTALFEIEQWVEAAISDVVLKSEEAGSALAFLLPCSLSAQSQVTDRTGP